MKTNILLILLLAVAAAQGCTVCGRCLDCSKEVLADDYIDSIDGLLQAKIEELGYPLHLTRQATSQKIIYTIGYSSGLSIQLALSLSDMQIQLLSYSIQEEKSGLDPSKYKKAADGYYLMSDFSSSQVAEITRFMSTIVKTSIAEFKLVEVAFVDQPALIFRLKYQILSLARPLYQYVYVQSLGENSYQFLSTNYTETQVGVTLEQVNPLGILNDVWLPQVNSLLISQYASFLGSKPSILNIAQRPPFYQITYQVADTNYTFFVTFDYMQNRLLSGNITMSKQTTTTTTTTSSSQQQSQSQSEPAAFLTPATKTTTTAGQSSTQSSSTAGQSSTQSATTSGQSVTQSATKATTAVSGQSVSQQESQSQPSSIINSQSTQSATSQATKTTTSAATPSIASQTSSTSTSSLTAASSSSSTSASSSGFKEVSSSFSATTEYKQLLSFLTSIEVPSTATIHSIQQQQTVTETTYILVLQLNALPIPKEKTIFYQLEVSLKSGTYSLLKYSYLSLDSPNLTLLTLQDISSDSNIRIIAQYLLNQEYATMRADSRVIQIERDFPYYRFVFLSGERSYITIVVLYDVVRKQVQVMSVTSRQIATQEKEQENLTAAQKVTTTTSTTTSTGNSQSGSVGQQTATATKVDNTQSNIKSQTVQGQSQTQTVQGQSQGVQPSGLVPATKTTQTTTTSSTASQNQVSVNLVKVNKVDSTASAGSSNPTGQSQSSQQQTQQATSASSQQSSQSSVSAKSTSQSSQSQAASSSSSSSFSDQLSGFQPLAVDNPLYSYAASGIKKVSETFQQKGYTSSQIKYTNILYKLEGTVLTIVLKVQVDGKDYAFQYKGTVESNSTQQTASSTQQTTINAQQATSNVQQSTTSAQSQGQTSQSAQTSTVSKPSTQQSNTQSAGQINISGQSNQVTSTTTQGTSAATSATQSATQGTSVSGSQGQTQSQSSSSSKMMTSQTYQGSTYNRIPSQMAEQAYIRLFIQYLATTSRVYQEQYLLGIFTNPMIPYSLLFTYQYDQQLYHVSTTPTQIQSTLAEYFKTKNGTDRTQTQSQTTISTTTTTTQQVPAANAQNTIPLTPAQRVESQSSQASKVVEAQTVQGSTSTPGQSKQQTTQNTQPSQQSSVNSQQTVTSQSTNAQQQTASKQNVGVQPSSTSQQQTTAQQTIESEQSTKTQSTSTSQTQQQNSQQTSANGKITTNVPITTPTSTSSSTLSGSSTFSASSVSSGSSTYFGSSGSSGSSGSASSSSSSQLIGAVKVDPNCLCYDGAVCMRCAHRYYLTNNRCITIPLECLSYDISTGACYSCVPGYILQQGLCQPQSPVAYFYDNQCVTCFGNYKMVNKKCVYSPPDYPSSSPNYIRQKNILCFGWQGTKCVECLPGAFLSSRGVCELVDPFCSLFDYSKEVCNSCEQGYTLKGNKCYPQ